MGNIEYLGRIGYRHGKLMQGFLVNTKLHLKEIRNKKIVLLGLGENCTYAEKLLGHRNIKIHAYADNSKELWGKTLGEGRIYSPYELFDNDEYYFIISVNYNIATVRLQFMVYNIHNYSIFLNHEFHDFIEEDKEIHKNLIEAMNTICFEGEDIRTALPYIPESGDGERNRLGRINFLMYSTLWAHPAYLWEKELITCNQYKSILEIGPGFGLMSLVLLKIFSDVQIDWLLLGKKGTILEESDSRFDLGLIKTKFKDRVQEYYCILERDELPNKKYSLIILTEVFEHFVLNPVHTMKKIAEHLEDYGRVILTTPNWGHISIYQTWEEMPDCEDISEERYFELLKCGHVYQYNKDELITIFYRAGLAVEKYSLSDSNNHNFILKKKLS